MESLSALHELFAAKDIPLIGDESEFQSQLARLISSQLIPNTGYGTKLDGLIKTLGEVLSKPDASFLIPAYIEALSEVTPEDREVMLASAQQGVANGAHPQLYADWVAAIRLVQLAPDDKQETPEKISRLEVPNEVQSRLLGIVTDPERSLNWRLPIAMTLLNDDPSLPVDGVWQSIGVISEAMQNADFQRGDTCVSLAFRCALELKDDASFVPKGSEFAAAWKKKLLSLTNQRELTQEVVQSAIRFFHSLNQPAVINQIISRASDTAETRSVAALLIELGMTNQAMTVCKKLWTDPNSIATEVEPLFYTRKLDEGMPEFLKLVTNDGTRLLTEAMFASLPDPKTESDRADIVLAERLNRLAARYPDISFSSKMHNQLTLVLLSQADNAAEFVGTPLTEIASKIRTIELWAEDSNNDSKLTLNQKLLAAHVLLSIRNGNLQPLHDLTKMLTSDVPTDNSWSFEQAVANIKHPIGATILGKIDSIPKETVREMLPDLRELSAVGRQGNYGSQEYYPMLLVAHAFVDETAAFQEWFRSRSEGEEGTRSGGDLDDLWPVIADRIRESSSTDDAERIRKISSMWTLASECGFSVGSGHFQEGVKESCPGCSKAKMGLDALCESGLISTEEIASVGTTLAEINSVNGEIWRQVGHEQLKQKKFAEAAESFRKAIAGAKEEMKQARSNRMVEYAFALQQSGKLEESKTQLNEVDSSQLLGDNIQRFTVLKSELDK
jgi:hypothetical protein